MAAGEELKIALGMNASLIVEGTVFGNVKDVTLNLSRSTADVTTRENGGWRANVGTLREATVSFQAVVSYGANVSDYNLFLEQYLGDATTKFIGVAVLDRSKKDGGQGPVADWSVTSCNRSEALEDAVTYDIELSVVKFYGWADFTSGENTPEGLPDDAGQDVTNRWNTILGLTT